MRILHVNDVSSVGSLLVQASGGRDELYQPVLRRRIQGGWKTPRLVWGRMVDMQRIRHRFTSGGFSHLHVHYGSFGPLAAGRSYSLHLHGSDLLRDLGGGFKSRLTRWGIRHARVVAVSTPNLLSLAGRLRPDAVYIPNPMTIPAPGPSRPRLARPQVMVLSKMDPNKGWPRQIDIVRSLKETLGDFQFSFIADGQLPAEERAALTRELVNLGGEPRPAMDRAAYLSLVANADFALGQLGVGALGMSELEAMAAGVPTVVDAREHFKLGFHPEVIEPERAASVIPSLWNAEEQLAVFRARAREYVAEVHDPERALKALEMLLSSLPGTG